MIDNASSQAVAWYRSPIDGKTLRALHERSDWLGFLQTGGYLGIIVLTGTSAYLAIGRLPVWAVVGLFLLHGMCCSFMRAATHELAHGTVFKTKALNSFFARFFSFFAWTTLDLGEASHARHHRYTLHPPDDLEVVLPMKLMIRDLFFRGIVNPGKDFFGWGAYGSVQKTVRIARGRFAGEWEEKLMPESEPEKRQAAIRWARFMLAGHAAILAVSIYFKLWMLPVLISFSTCYGGGLFLLLTNAQHIGLCDNVPDFRLCCRTVVLNPVLRFLYWSMNYHMEHHMYAAVPCYRLGRVHERIKADIPDCPRGVIAMWRQISEILDHQKRDPSFQYHPPLPQTAGYQHPEISAGAARKLAAG